MVIFHVSASFHGGKLLKDTGFIFISIDDNEYANLKLMMDEIFGEGGFVTNVMWKRKKRFLTTLITFPSVGNTFLFTPKPVRALYV